MSPESEVPNSAERDRRWIACVTIGAIVLAVAVGSTLAQVSRAAMSKSASTQATSTTDEVRTIPIEVIEAKDGVYAAAVLMKDGAVYRRTGERVSFKVPEDTPYIMGGAADLRPGGTAQVRGKSANGIIVADRIVILTTSIKVE